MLLLPPDMVAFLAPFEPLFSRPVWRHVQLLVVGAILAPGRRMVSSALRAVGLSHLPTFQTYHRVLNRAIWSSLDASRILLGLLVATFAGGGPLVIGIDETTRAPPWGQDRRRRHLPRSRALQPQPLRQGARPALDLRHALSLPFTQQERADNRGDCRHAVEALRLGAA